MPKAPKLKTEIVTIVREELPNSAKPFAALSADDLKKLKIDMQRAFDMSLDKDCGVIYTAFIPDNLFLSEIESEVLYGIVLANDGKVEHSFGPTIIIRTKAGHLITFNVVGTANFIAVSAQFMSVQAQARFGKFAGKEDNEEKAPKKTTTTAQKKPPCAAKARGKKPAPTPAPAPTKRATRASKKTNPASVLEALATPVAANKHGGTTKKALAVNLVDDDSIVSPPPPTPPRGMAVKKQVKKVMEDQVESVSDLGTSDSESSGSYAGYHDMGLTQEATVKEMTQEELDAMEDEVFGESQVDKEYARFEDDYF
jgi:hypothetical protein